MTLSERATHFVDLAHGILTERGLPSFPRILGREFNGPPPVWRMSPDVAQELRGWSDARDPFAAYDTELLGYWATTDPALPPDSLILDWPSGS